MLCPWCLDRDPTSSLGRIKTWSARARKTKADGSPSYRNVWLSQVLTLASPPDPCFTTEKKSPEFRVTARPTKVRTVHSCPLLCFNMKRERTKHQSSQPKAESRKYNDIHRVIPIRPSPRDNMQDSGKADGFRRQARYKQPTRNTPSVLAKKGTTQQSVSGASARPKRAKISGVAAF